MTSVKTKSHVEYLVAGTALFVSLTTPLVYMYQAKVMKEQQHVSVWPCIEWNTTNVGDYHLSVTNKGVGPALIRKVEMTLDGKAVANNRELVTAVMGPDWTLVYYTSSLQGRVLTPGETVMPFRIPDEGIGRAFEVELRKHQFELRITYCSVYGDCWVSTGHQVERRPKVNLGLY